MNASSESGEWATEIVCFVVSNIYRTQGSGGVKKRWPPMKFADLRDRSRSFYSIVVRIPLDRFKAGFLDQADKFRSRHLHLVVVFDLITFGQFAFLGNGAFYIV